MFTEKKLFGYGFMISPSIINIKYPIEPSSRISFFIKESDSKWQIYDRFIDHFQTDTNSLEIEPIKITLLVVTAVQTKSGI